MPHTDGIRPTRICPTGMRSSSHTRSIRTASASSPSAFTYVGSAANTGVRASLELSPHTTLSSASIVMFSVAIGFASSEP
jgi:hypothetical protein